MNTGGREGNEPGRTHSLLRKEERWGNVKIEGLRQQKTRKKKDVVPPSPRENSGKNGKRC